MRDARREQPRHVPRSVRLAILTFESQRQIGWGLAALMTLAAFAFLSPAKPAPGAEAGYWVWTASVLVTPAIGVAIALRGIGQNLRYVELLRRGQQAMATFESKHREGEAIGEPDSETEVWLSFRDEEGELHNLVHLTGEPQRLEDDAREIVFYDPHQPQRAVALDFLPGKLELRGERFLATGAVWGYLIAPAVAIAAAALVLATVAQR